MIRFLQTPGPIKKIVLSGILVVICISMAWFVLPGGGNSVLGFGGPTAGVVATVSGEDIKATDVQRQASDRRKGRAVALPFSFPPLGVRMI